MAGPLDKDDAEDVAWLVIEALADSAKIGEIAKVLHFYRDLCKTVDGLDEDIKNGIAPNPFFLDNGHGGASRKTSNYQRNRRFKTLGGGAVGLAGALGSSATAVDVGGIALHGNASVSTSVHLVQIKALGSGYKKSETITNWIDALMKAKSAKLAIRGTGLAAAAIPVAALGLASGIATTVMKLGVKVTLGKFIARTSMEIHWRAFQECKIASAFGGSSGPQGPASAMFYEIFTKRGFTRVFGKYDIAGLMNEPGGWMALNDKLMLM